MKYNLVALAATPVLILASSDPVPPKSYHDPAWGNAIVENHCKETAYYVYDCHPERRSLEPSASMSVPIYLKIAENAGGSIKIFTDKDTDLFAVPRQPVTQFEITPNSTQGMQFVDVSNVNTNLGNGMDGNGNPCDGFPPFMEGGLKIAAPGRDDIVCPPGVNPCTSVYSKYDDDWATFATGLGEDVKLVLCPDGGSSLDDPDGDGLEHSVIASTQATSIHSPTQTAEYSLQHGSIPTEAADSSHQQPEPENPDEDIVWVTQIVTAAPHVETVRVGADDKSANEGHKKRHNHIHEHARNKLNKRRHGA
ncbi:MAG: hypothetical protein Q9163_006033 [Psora crenata]